MPSFPLGYWHDESMWPWELYELLNLAAAVERADEFDIIHYEAGYFPMSLAFARLVAAPMSQTLHHAPSDAEVDAVERYPDAPFIAISREQARLLDGLNVAARCCTASTPTASFQRNSPTITCCSSAALPRARACCRRSRSQGASACGCCLPQPKTQYYREHVAPLVDGTPIVYVGEVDFDAKVKLFGGARALLYPVQAGEPFGLVLAEAMACGTPVAALDRGAVRELVDDGVTGVRVRRPRRDGQRPRPGARPRSPAGPRARRRALRRRSHGRRLRRRLSTDRRAGERARRDRRAPLLQRANGARGVRAPRRRIAGLRRHAGPSRRRRRARRHHVRDHMANGARQRHGGPRRRAGARARAELQRGRGRARRRRGRSSGSSATAICAGRMSPISAPNSSLLHADATGRTPSSPSAKTASTGIPITSACTSGPHRGPVARRRRAAAVLRDDAARRHAPTSSSSRSRGLDGADRRGSGALMPDAFGDCAQPPTLAVDVGDWVPRKLAAHPLPPDADGRGHPFALSRGRRAATARRRVLPPARHPTGERCTSMLESDLCTSTCWTSCAARSAAAGSSWSTSMFHRTDGDEIHDGILGCHCCIFPVVDGIPVLHLQPARDRRARAHRGAAARISRCGRWSASTTMSRRKRSRPPRRRTTSHLPGHRRRPRAELRGRLLPLSLFRSHLHRGRRGGPRRGGNGAADGERRAVDVCGGSGHLTRSLLDLSSPAPVLADLFFPKIWLARRFTAPGCEPVCCDGNAPMPFARGAFDYAMCSDAFMFIWTKRQFVGELLRSVEPAPSDRGRGPDQSHAQSAGLEPVASASR